MQHQLRPTASSHGRTKASAGYMAGRRGDGIVFDLPGPLARQNWFDRLDVLRHHMPRCIDLPVCPRIAGGRKTGCECIIHCMPKELPSSLEQGSATSPAESIRGVIDAEGSELVKVIPLLDQAITQLSDCFQRAASLVGPEIFVLQLGSHAKELESIRRWVASQSMGSKITPGSIHVLDL